MGLGLRGRAEAGQTLSPDALHQRYQAEINDLENLGEMGSGTCGQVWKMRFRKTGHVIAVKVSTHPARVSPMPLSSGAKDLLPSPCHPVQQMRRSGNKEENKRILMDLDVVLKSHDCPYIVQCFGTFITNVSLTAQPLLFSALPESLLAESVPPAPVLFPIGVGKRVRPPPSHACCPCRRMSSLPWSSWAPVLRS